MSGEIPGSGLDLNTNGNSEPTLRENSSVTNLIPDRLTNRQKAGLFVIAVATALAAKFLDGRNNAQASEVEQDQLCPPGVYPQFNKIAITGEQAFGNAVIDLETYKGEMPTKVLFSFGDGTTAEDTDLTLSGTHNSGYELNAVVEHVYQKEAVGDRQPYVVLGNDGGWFAFCRSPNNVEIYFAHDWMPKDMKAEAGTEPSWTFDANNILPEEMNQIQQAINTDKEQPDNIVGGLKIPYDWEVSGIGGKRNNNWGGPIYDVARFKVYSVDKRGNLVSTWWPRSDSDGHFLRPENDMGADPNPADLDPTFKDEVYIAPLIVHPDNPRQRTNNVVFSIKPPEKSYAAYWNDKEKKWVQVTTTPPAITSIEGSPLEVLWRPRKVLIIPTPTPPPIREMVTPTPTQTSTPEATPSPTPTLHQLERKTYLPQIMKESDKAPRSLRETLASNKVERPKEQFSGNVIYSRSINQRRGQRYL